MKSAMQSQIQNLTREGMLLLYIAGELSDTDRAQVDQMLAADPALTGELQALRETEASCRDALAELDGAEHGEHARTRESIAGRDATRLVRQWTLRQRATHSAPPMRRAIPWVRYGVSIAASLLIGYLVWTTFALDGTGPKGHSTPIVDKIQLPDENSAPNDTDLAAQDQLALLADTFDLSASADASNVRLAAASQIADLDFFDNVP
jgi:hypothetical protein